MGLRIIDRHPKAPPQKGVSDAERQAYLEAESRRWPKGRFGDASSQKEFLAHFNRVRAHLSSEAGVEALAARIRENIVGQHGDCALSHNRVDIATLLELL